MATTKKKPSALNSAKKRIEELQADLNYKNSQYEALAKDLEVQKSANSAMFKNFDEIRKEKQQFEEETSEYEGLRKFLLGKLKNKRPEYVNSLFTNVKETINTDLLCKSASLKEELKSLEQSHDKLSASLLKAESYRL